MIHLIRHAHTVWNGPPRRFQGRAEAPLSDAGRAAAAQSSPTVPKPARLIRSPLGRCAETSALLYPGVEAEVDERWVEMDVGRFSGLLEDEARSAHPAAFDFWMNTPHLVRIGETGERLLDVTFRVGAALLDAAEWSRTHNDAPVVIVSHGGAIRAARCLFEDVPLSDFHRIPVPNLGMISYSVDVIRASGEDKSADAAVAVGELI